MSKRILVVDDEQSIVTLLKYNLEQAGYEVITALDGEEGLRLAVEEAPELLVLDLMLPKLDGLEVCKQLRQLKVNVPILMLTAKDDEFDKVLGLELGAEGAGHAAGVIRFALGSRSVTIGRAADNDIPLDDELASAEAFDGAAPSKALAA